MVKELRKSYVSLYVCQACGFAYEENELAEKCQHWCQQPQSCNLEITQHTVPLE